MREIERIGINFRIRNQKMGREKGWMDGGMDLDGWMDGWMDG
jgi:hypothetical protein